MHRDIALRNVLLNGNKTAKLSDFGLAVRVSGAEYWSRQEVPTPYKWGAPESLAEAVYSVSSDVWSLGVMIWEMFSLASDPWPEVVSPGGLMDLLGSGARLPEVSRAPGAVTSLMGQCWSAQPHMRPSAAEVTERLRSVLHGGQTSIQETEGHYKIPNQIVPSRSFYWTNYKILKGNPITAVSLNNTDESQENKDSIICDV